ncbi:AAA family ATPase [Bradyrhizobium sp. STM 3562]|uniref:AAA family ATPase n=1 Tax=Bradyrhizobium sp. STM 3562 TaxID=578924 RepID=UPI0038904A76
MDADPLRSRALITADVEAHTGYVVSWVEDGVAFGSFPGIGARVINNRVAVLNRRSTATPRRAPLKIFTADRWDGKAVPEAIWHVPGLIPARTVTLLGGDGATGKSLLAQQLAAATVLGRPWVGFEEIGYGSAIYFSAEDDEDELHRRFARIVQSYDASFVDLAALHIIPLAGEDAVLAGPNGRGNVIETTELWKQLELAVEEIRPSLVVLDTLADLFSGDENQRAQARQFIGLLRGLAIRYETTPVVLAHPSLSGMASGSGSSGNTGWSNSVRSRLYLERVFVSDAGEKSRLVEPDETIRELSVKKANYAQKGQPIRLKWADGVFERQDGDFGLDRAERDQRAELVFMSLLRWHEEHGINVSPKPSAAYAPTVFARHGDAQGISKRAFAGALERLLSTKRIAIETIGPPSRQTTRLTAYNG